MDREDMVATIAVSVAALVALAGFTLFCSVAYVGPTEVGLPVYFGEIQEPLSPGLHLLHPLSNVHTFPLRPVTAELSGETAVMARTADAGQIKVELAVRWRVAPDKAKDLFLQVRTGDDDKISNDIVAKNLRQAVGQVYSLLSNLEAMSDRSKVTLSIKEQLQTQLSTYGIVIDDVNLRSVEPDATTAATIAKFSSQQQATRIAEEAKKTATIEAERRLIESQGLNAASATVAKVEPEVLCMQLWQQAVMAGIERGVPVYTSPCGGASNIVSAK